MFDSTDIHPAHFDSLLLLAFISLVTCVFNLVDEKILRGVDRLTLGKSVEVNTKLPRTVRTTIYKLHLQFTGHSLLSIKFKGKLFSFKRELNCVCD